MFFYCLLLFFACVTAKEELKITGDAFPSPPTFTTEWKNAVEEAILSISASGLSESFNSEYMSKRDFSTTLKAQAARLRAHLLVALLTCVDTELVVEVPKHFTKSVMDSVTSEFKLRGFKVQRQDHVISFENIPPAQV